MAWADDPVRSGRHRRGGRRPSRRSHRTSHRRSHPRSHRPGCSRRCNRRRGCRRSRPPGSRRAPAHRARPRGRRPCRPRPRRPTTSAARPTGPGRGTGGPACRRLSLGQCGGGVDAGHLGLGEVALRLGEPGAGVGADGAAPAGDEVLGRRDGRARGEQRLVPRGGGAAARGLRVAGGDEAAVEGGVGFVDEPQRGHRVGGRGVLRGGRRGQRGLGARDEPGKLARRPARFARGQQGAGFGDVLFGLGAGREMRSPAAASSAPSLPMPSSSASACVIACSAARPATTAALRPPRSPPSAATGSAA